MSNRTLGVSIVAVVLIALVVWLGLRVYHSSELKNTTESVPTNQSQPQTNTPTSMPNTAECVRSFDPAKLKTAVEIKNQFVTLEVQDYGTVRVQLYDKDAPKAVENFLKLTNAGFYDCLTFHRIAKGFVIQGGDDKGNGTGGITASGEVLVDELNPATPSYKAGYMKGVLAMANAGPDTSSSQFFIMLDDNTILPHDYTIFGKVVSGQEFVDKIGQVDITPRDPRFPTDGTPKIPIVITKATISK